MVTHKHQSPVTNHQSLNIDGILLVNKPKDLTSFRVVYLLRKHFGVKKVGHGGTLDPLATGLLLLLFGKATKTSSTFLEDDKEYEGTIVFGKETDTYDVTGKVVRTSVVPSGSAVPAGRQEESQINKKIIRQVFKEFEGSIMQIPPPYSAIKVNGKKAYELARKGRTVELKKRKVNVYFLKLTQLQNNEHVKAYFSTKVSKGTYIRSLAHDIGKKLVTGAYLEELKRTASGKFLLKDAFELEEVLKWDKEKLQSVILRRP